jgi:thymidylate synthase
LRKISDVSQDWFKAKEEYIAKIKNEEEFAKEHGELGPVYGTQWRHWKVTDEKIGE